MKKFLALVMAMMMVLAMGTVAFADGGEAGDNTATPTATPAPQFGYNVDPYITKEYKINNGTAPAETFVFKFTPISYTAGNGTVSTDAEDIPAITNKEISFEAISADAKESVSLGISADDYELGVYKYKVEEVTPNENNGTNTAGVTYLPDDLYLTVTVLRNESSEKNYIAAIHYGTANGTKSSAVVNEYDAGSLTVSKEITGNLANMNDTFAFTITFVPAANTAFDTTVQINDTVYGSDKGKFETVEGVYTYTVNLGDGDSVAFTNIPDGTTYTVSEVAGDYTSDGGVWSDTAEKVISADENATVTFTNTLGTTDIDTGISMDSAPYIMIMAMVVLAGVAMMMKRRAY